MTDLPLNPFCQNSTGGATAAPEAPTPLATPHPAGPSAPARPDPAGPGAPAAPGTADAAGPDMVEERARRVGEERLRRRGGTRGGASPTAGHRKRGRRL
jgi:hypothetical protein